jgi:DNA-directed RNA polymerase specialized sigma24 family protein
VTAKKIASDSARRIPLAVSFEDDEMHKVASGTPSALDLVLGNELLEDLRQAMSPILWRILKARFVDEKSIKSIAESEGLRERAVQLYIMKGREKARSHIEAQRGGPGNA